MDNRSANRAPRTEQESLNSQDFEGLRRGIFSTPGADGVTTEAAKGIGEAAVELAKDLNELEHAEEYVGTESELQVEERLAEDRADLQAEMGVGDPLTVKVMAKSQEELSKAVAPEVNKFLNQKSFRPAELQQVYRARAEQARGVFGRVLGERN